MRTVSLPWWGKIAAKVVFSRLNTSYSFWQRLGLFKHGPMENPEYAYQVFKKHFDRVTFGRQAGWFVAAELGPGDTLGTALVAAAFGASRTYLVDVGAFARSDLTPYLALYDYLKRLGLTPPDVRKATSLGDVLKACNAEYLTNGLASLEQIPDASVDFVFSNAVYEHIRRREVGPMTREVRRVLRPDGVTSHSIDLKDHLGGGLSNLRFGDRVWESDFMTKSGFYTNRLRATDFVRLFEESGLKPRQISSHRWDVAPLKRRHLAEMFRGYSDDELLISDIDVVATR